MYEIMWHGDWHGEVASGLAEHLRRRGFAVDLSRSGSFAGRTGKVRLSKGIYVRDTAEPKYALIDFKDLVGHKNNSVVRDLVHDDDCRLILKGQYRRQLYRDPPFSKIQPYTYFEKAPTRFQTLLPELRNAERRHGGLYFRGATRGIRESILSCLRGIVCNANRRLPVDEYYRDSAAARIGLALPGNANVCHREIEYFGIGIPTVMPTLKNSFHEPLIPNVHYIAVDVNTTQDSARTVAREIRRAYERCRDDESLLVSVTQNAMAWYERNVRFPGSIALTARLLGLSSGG